MLERVTRGAGALIAAAVFGSVHAAFSLYWGLGGRWLEWSLGADLVERFDSMRPLLIPVALLKFIGALAPVMLARRGWHDARIARPLAWLVSAGLIAWGGLNTIVGQLVLAGAIRPDGGYDRDGMIGHAWMWDPLFLAWGAALAMGMWRSRIGHELST